MEPKVEFSRIRDFGETINDSINFVKQNFKALFTPLLYISLIFILAAMATGILVQVKTIGLVGAEMAGPVNAFDGTAFLAGFGINYVLYLLFYFISFTVVQLVTLCFIDLYRKNGNVPPTKEEVWIACKAHFWRFILASLLLSIIVAIATMLCILPGIYLFPIASLVYAIVVMDEAPFDQAFTRAFTLIKDNWWKTFGVLFIVWLIAYFSIGLVALPGTLMTMSGFLLGESSSLTLTGAILNVVIQSFGMLVYSLPTIALALCYFSLSEEKEGTGLMERIENLGTHADTGKDLPNEEY